jgi:hypothetical protein
MSTNVSSPAPLQDPVNFRFPGGMIGTFNTGYCLDKGKQLQIGIWGSLRRLPRGRIRNDSNGD